MPNPFPTEEKISAIRTIARTQKSFAEISSLIAALNDSEWAEMDSAITRFASVKDDYTEIEDGLLGANISPRQKRLDITNEVRRRLGMAEITEYGTEVFDQSTGSKSKNVPIDGW